MGKHKSFRSKAVHFVTDLTTGLFNPISDKPSSAPPLPVPKVFIFLCVCVCVVDSVFLKKGSWGLTLGSIFVLDDCLVSSGNFVVFLAFVWN